MCGIAGIVDLEGARAIDPALLKRMTDAIAHRGPDGEGFHIEPGVGFGHRRLAIIDLVGGVQPVHSSGGEAVMVFNGEIYNYRDLRRALEQQGARFRTQSDTEVLIEGLVREGPDYIGKLRGMFAFAIWNRRQRRLLLARDRFGEKPLYYTVTKDGFLIFGSEIGAVAASGQTPFTLSRPAVHDYFLFGYVPEPQSIYEDVFKLPPAHTMTVERSGAPASRAYWRAEFRPDPSLDFDAAKKTLLEKLDDAVTAQLVSDVPLGAFLSGGVDSSAIVSSMGQGDAVVRTCTIGFDDKGHDERVYARETAKRYDTQHSEDVVKLDATGLIDRLARVYGEPFADASALPTYLVCEAARRHVTVALSGDGGDEIFAGYRRYAFFAAEERVRRLAPAFFRRATFGVAGTLYPKADWAPRYLRLKTTLQALGETSAAAYLRAASASLPDRHRQMLAEDFLDGLRAHDPLRAFAAPIAGKALDPLSFVQTIDINSWLPGRMLTKVDRAAMAHGLEVRAPFLDHRLAEWAMTLPASFRLSAGVGKRILKAAIEPRISKDILYRPKQGFSPPTAAWLRDPKGPLTRLRDSGAWRRDGALDAPMIEQMMTNHAAGVSDYSQELWAVIMYDAFLNSPRA
jgi:asparagine synthase (glutamine-hydrolysing)